MNDGTGAAAGAPSLARGDPWWGVALMALVVVGVCAGVVALSWRAMSRGPLPIERYVPTEHGLALLYRVTLPDGRELRQQWQLARDTGPGAPRGTERFAVDVTMTTSGVPTATLAAWLVEPDRAAWAYQGELSYDPPLPLLELGLEPGVEHVAAGSLGRFAGDALQPAGTYTATFALEGREPLDTPLGQLDDCLRLRYDVLTTASREIGRAWFCAGVGVARLEAQVAGQPGPIRYELIETAKKG